MQVQASEEVLYYPALTGLRALAAFAVFGFHYRSISLFGLPALDTVCQTMLSELHIGVSIFFTLSGFLITKRYAQRQFNRAEWSRYLGHRIARIFPVYALLLTATFAAQFSNPSGKTIMQAIRLYLVNLTLLKGFLERFYFSGIGQAWSLTVEESFYFLAPAIFMLGRRYKPMHIWPILSVGMIAIGIFIYTTLPEFGSLLFMLKVTIFGRLTEFLCGVFFAWSSPRPSNILATSSGAAVVVTLFVLLVSTDFTLHKVSIDSYPGIFINNWLLPLATGWMIHGLATESTRLSRLLSTPSWQVMGKASYCFYLLHIGIVPDKMKPILWHWLPGNLALVFLFGFIILASLAMYQCVEKPAHRWLLNKLAMCKL